MEPQMIANDRRYIPVTPLLTVDAVIIYNGKLVLIRRKNPPFQGHFALPGGFVEIGETVEEAVVREAKEETGLEIKNITYLTSLATIHEDGSPSLVISCLAEHDSGEIILQEEENDKHAWVSLEEAKNYDLLDGIYDELVMAENQRKGIKTEWKRF